MWRVVLGYPFAFLSGIDELGVWRPPGVEGVEVLVSPPVAVTPDPREHTLAGALAAAGWDGADAYLHCTPEYYPLPPDAFEATRHLAVVIADWNVAGRVSQVLRGGVDAIVCDHTGVDVLSRPEGPPVLPGLLWGWDRDGWPEVDPDAPRDIDVLFVGNRNPSIHPRRERWLARLGRMAGRVGVEIHSDVYGATYRELHARARLVFNFSVRGEANMRAFEAPIAGACVLNERANGTLRRAYVPDIEYATYDEGDLEGVVTGLLADDERRRAIARAGQLAARRHSYDEHWAAILRSLRDALDGARPRRHRSAVRGRVLGEQWRCTWRDVALAHAADLAPKGADRRRLAAISALGGPTGMDAAGWERTLGLLDDALAAEPDRVDLLIAHAEAARVTGDDDLARASARRALAADEPADPTGLAATRYDDWQMALERALLGARRPRDVRAAAHRWIRRRAGWILASAGPEDGDPDVEELLAGAEEIYPMLVVRARLRLIEGYVEPALDDFHRLLTMRPLDSELAIEVAGVLGALGRVDEARRILGEAAASLAGFPAADADHRRLRARARRPRPAPEDIAWCWAEDLDADELVAVVEARLAGSPESGRLRLAVSGPDALDPTAEALLRALADRGAAPDDLPDTELVVDAHPPSERWRRVAGAAVVIAREGSRDDLIAGRAGRPVLRPGAAAPVQLER